MICGLVSVRDQGGYLGKNTCHRSYLLDTTLPAEVEGGSILTLILIRTNQCIRKTVLRPMPVLKDITSLRLHYPRTQILLYADKTPCATYGASGHGEARNDRGFPYEPHSRTPDVTG